MSDSSRVQLASIKEVTWGVTPASALTSMRYVNEGLGRRIENVRSDEVRSDRQVSDIIRVGSSGDGPISFELSHNTYHDKLEAALGSTFAALQTITNTGIAAVAATPEFTGTGLPVFAVGQWVRVSGFATAANNGFWQVVTSSATNLAVANGAATLVNEAAGASVTIVGQTMANGTTAASFTLEKYFSDLSLFWPFRGCRLNTLSLALASRAKVTGSMEFMGIGGAMTNATAGSGAYSAATTTSIMSASNNVARLLENGAALAAGTYVKSLNLQFSNNLRSQDAIGTIDPIGIGYGRFTCTGEMTVYFQSETLFNRYANGNDSGIAVILNTPSPENDAYIFTLPAIEYMNADVVGSGNDQDVMVTMEFEAKMHATQGIMARIDTFT